MPKTDLTLMPISKKSDDPELMRQELEFLRSENEKLEKINAALMYRMEEGGFNHRAYSAFEHSVQLSEKVSEQTEQIHAVLQELEQSNFELAKAHEEANKAKQRLHDAIESINQAMVLIDSTGSITFFNRHFETVWDNLALSPTIGDNFFDITQRAKTLGAIRRAFPPDTEGRVIYQLNNSKWYQLTIRKTREGGKVILFNDITEVKLIESNRYEKVIGEKNKLLQSLIDSVDLGILLVNKSGRIEFWNNAFLRYTNIAQRTIESCYTIYALHKYTNLSGLSLDPSGEKTQILNENLVVERNITMLSNGNTLYTLTNITSLYQYQQTLKQNESWIRMITDNVPALIAYIGSARKFQYTNKGYRDWYGLSEEDFQEVPIEKSHLRNIYPRLATYLERVSRGEVVEFLSEETNVSGRTGFLQKVYLPHFGDDGKIVGHFVLATDISEQIKGKQQLEQAKQELESRVDERTKELHLANKALLEAVDSKSKFLAALSHDLLQPLSAAILFNESLKTRVDDKIKPVLGSLENSLIDLERLIRTLIDISKLDAGMVKPDKQPTDVTSILNQLADEFAHISQDYGVTFNSRFQDVVVHTDVALLSRILRNLLINAMKYGANGKVLFVARKIGANLRISVFDQGVGISEQDQQIIFKEFSRLKNNFNYSQSLGLGLSIVDKTSKVLGHEVTVVSEEGKGSCFSISIPVAKFTQTQSAHRYSLPNPQAMPLDMLDKQIWHIDNDPNMRIAMQTLFENWGLDIQTFSSYEQCAKVMGNEFEQCDLLILDYHLDDNENGLDVARLLNQAYPSLPIMICTANHSSALAMEVGSLDMMLLHKPINPMKLKLFLTSMFVR